MGQLKLGLRSGTEYHLAHHWLNQNQKAKELYKTEKPRQFALMGLSVLKHQNLV